MKTAAKHLLAAIFLLALAALAAVMSSKLDYWPLLVLLWLAAAGVATLYLRSLYRAPKRSNPEIPAVFPEEWRKILHRYSVYYNALPADRQAVFEARMLEFLQTHRVQGVGIQPDDTSLVLIAASAAIVTFGYEDWQLDGFGEILLYPAAWGQQMEPQGGSQWTLSGMLGSSYHLNALAYSRADLLAGYANPQNHRNVGIHEMVHVLDKADGGVDGMAAWHMTAAERRDWQDELARQMESIRQGSSKLEPYAGYSPPEFLAVTSEYFFENPEWLHRHYPELYRLLAALFQQDTLQLFRQAIDRSTAAAG